jgi:predicted dehydrogenase
VKRWVLSSVPFNKAPPGRRTPRWGLIGCGDIARKRVAPALNNSVNSKLVAVSRANAELLDSFADEFCVGKRYPDWRDLVQDPEIDAVYVATPVYLHADQTIAAANAGKHILCEKPMALDPAQCEQMIAACNRNRVKLGIAYYRHFYSVIRRIKEIIESGELGVPVFAQINAFEWFNPEPGHPREWLLQPERSGGGPMFDFGCHRVEVLLDLLGPITDVKSELGSVLFEREVEDVAIAQFRFESGACASLSVSHAAFEPQDTLNLFFSRGSIHVPVLNNGTMRVVDEHGERVEKHPAAQNIHQPLIEDFVSALIEDRPPVVGGEIGRRVAEIVERIYRRGE